MNKDQSNVGAGNRAQPHRQHRNTGHSWWPRRKSDAGQNNNQNTRNNNNYATGGSKSSNQTRPKSTPIGYVKLKEFLNEYEDGDLILRLSSETGGFMTLLQEPKIRPDLLCLILEILEKVADSSTDAHTRHMVIHLYSNLMPQLNTKSNTLFDHLNQFIGNLLVQLKGANKQQFMRAVDHLLTFLRSLQETMLKTSADAVESIIFPLSGIIDHMNCKGCVFKTDTMDLYMLIKDNAEQFNRKGNKDEASINSVAEEYKPPNDFRQISICPLAEDIQFDYEQFLPKNIIDGCYRSGVDHYLDIQFRLLREDFVRPLRLGVTEYIQLVLKNPKKARQLKKVGDLNVYHDVRIVGSMLKNGDIINFAQFDKNAFKNVRWQFSKRLMHGSLVCLSPDNFQHSLCFATIAMQRDTERLANGEFYLKFEFSNRLTDSITSAMSLTMVESLIYFEAYRHNLRVLQSMTPREFPLKEYIVEVSTDIHPPLYLDEHSVFDLSKLTVPLPSLTYVDHENEEDLAHRLRFSSSAARCRAIRLLDNQSWPAADNFGFDESQYAAFKAALTQQIAVIQGPPGTGKTYVGLRIAQALLENRKNGVFFNSILVICYSNHALDQFLEMVYQFNKSIVRIGGKSRSDVLQSVNLQAIRKENNTVPGYIRQNRWEVRKKIETLHTVIAHHEHMINNVMENIMGNELEDTLRIFNTEHCSQVSIEEDFDNGLLIFLGYKIVDQSPEAADVETNAADGDVEDQSDNNNIENQIEEEIDEEELLIMEAIRIVDDINDGDGDDDKSERAIGGKTKNYAQIFEDKDGYITDQKHNKKRHRNYIRNQLRSNDCMMIEEANAVHNIWNLTGLNRWRLYRLWVRQYTMHLEDSIKELRRQINMEWKSYEAIGFQMDIELVRKFEVIGMTTTGAAKYHHIIDGIKPQIVIVEEAAEVLEAHIVTSLSSCSEHLILIGDHQQLKPNPAVYELAVKYNLEVSLFERLIRNKIAYHQLKKQHRMRPQISSLLVPHIYKELEDHPSVYEYEDVKGVSKSLFFVNHHEIESSVTDTSSRMNDHEARFAVELCRYLILQGYKSNQITILTTYSGQLIQIRALMKMKQTMLYGVRATVVDNFQGEECDIIILTMVRSNIEGNVGFLKVSNRVNVALSRAKMGLYCIGNFDCLQEKSPLWRNIVQVLQKCAAIGDTLEVYCQNHPNVKANVAKDTDFKQTPEGGCTLPCDVRLKCGHTCPSTCHVADREHEQRNCTKKCDSILCELQHRCKSKCHYGQPCGQCSIIVEKLRPICGHTVSVKCAVSTANHYCTNRCAKLRSCGHPCQIKCGDECDSRSCGHIIATKSPCGHEVSVRCGMANNQHELTSSCREACKTILECGHLCKGTCGECFQGRFHKSCTQKCTSILVCEHACTSQCCVSCPPCTKRCTNSCVHSRCTAKCGQPCVECKEKCTWRCPHKVCTKLCYEPCDRDLCMEPCEKLLKCQHPCIGLCGESCPKLCRICHQDQVEEIFFGTEDEPDARFIQLFDCDHVLEATGLVAWMKAETDTKNENSAVQMKACPKCKTVIRKTKSLNIFISKSLTNLNLVKRKMFGDPKDNKLRQAKLHNDIKAYKQKGALAILNNLHAELLNTTKTFERKNAAAMHIILGKENIFDLLKRITDIHANAASVMIKRGYADQGTAQQIVGRISEIARFITIYKDVNQQMKDITREMTFVQLVVDVLVEVSQREWNIAGRQLLNEAFKLATALGPATESIKSRFKGLVEEASKLQSGIGISFEEKQMVLQAMQLAKGHWFKCPNGHVYCIGDCGGAMVEAKCPECECSIGGGSHRLRADNSLATEMDHAARPAWPTNFDY